MRFDVFFAENTNKEVTEKEVKKLLASKNPEYAYSSAYIGRDTYKKYKDLFEAKILESPYWTVKYVTDVLNGIRAVTHKPHKRWPKGESVIAKDPYASWLYARYIIYGRWPQGEKAIFDSEDPQYKDIYLDFLNSIGYQDEDNQELSFESHFNEEEGDVITKPLYDEEGYVDLDKCIKYAVKEGKRWPELEKLLISHHYFNSAIRYANRVLKGRWLELEEILNSENYSTASDFKEQYLDMLKDLGYEDEDNEEQQEDVITRDLITAIYRYGKEAVQLDDCIDYAAKIGKRWPKLEQYIIYTHFPGHGIDYAKRVLKGRWLELENFLQKYYDEGNYYRDEYLKMLQDIGYQDEDNEELSFESYFTEAKSKVRPPSQDELTDPLSATIYASQVLGGRWKEKEELIASKALSAFQYAIQVLKDRWINIPDISKNIAEFAEGAIRKSSMYSVPYAEQIIKDRWPELEKDILDFRKNVTAVHYAVNVLKRRWPEAEPFIMKWDDTKEDYINFLNDLGYEDEDNEEQDENVIDKPLFLTPGTNGVMVVDDYRCLQYAVEQGKRWPEFEKHVIHSAKLATGVQYAKDVIKGRWPALEPLLKPLPYLQSIYIRYLNDIGYEDEDNQELSFESFFSENTQTPTSAVAVYELAKELGERLPEYEHIILNDKTPDAPAFAYEYLKKIINKNAAADQDRVTWPEAEPLLAKDADTAYRYALYYINAKYWDDEDYDTKPLVRFPLGEPEIAKDAYTASRYARYILKDRWPEGEKAIASSEYEMRKYVEFLNEIGYEDED